MKYTNTVNLTNRTQLETLHPGQWVRLPSGEKGQFLGVTRSRVEVILYKRDRVTGNLNSYMSQWNANLQKLRGFAKANGSK